jgi:hypothetical protein
METNNLNPIEIKELIIEMLTENEEQSLFADGFDEAILGVDSISSRVIYSVSKCYLILQNRDGMSFKDAQEFLAFNVLASYVGEKTPIWCYDIF